MSYGDCPTCKYHPRYREEDRIGALCLHPLGELYRSEFDELHLVSICSGWKGGGRNDTVLENTT